VGKHRIVTDAVHAAGGKICLQILHTGRYAYHPLAVSASRLKSPISPFAPRALTGWGVRRPSPTTPAARASRAEGRLRRRRDHGLRGLPHQPVHRAEDQPPHGRMGRPFENRIRFAVEIVRRTREKVGPNFIIIFRLSMLDLVEDGSTWDEVVQLAKAIEAAGATIINTGIGWHEARIPTIATMVPRAAFTWVTRA
jgi:2,4-dienoyl-CoA reductase (NADPH2)